MSHASLPIKPSPGGETFAIPRTSCGFPVSLADSWSCCTDPLFSICVSFHLFKSPVSCHSFTYSLEFQFGRAYLVVLLFCVSLYECTNHLTMHISITSYCYIFSALFSYKSVTAKPLLSHQHAGKENLIERQSGDDAGSSPGDAAGIGTQPSQTQNTTSTTGSTGGTGNGTIANSPGFISQPGYVYDDQVDCRNLTTGRANKCWGELQLSEWVTNWTKRNTCYQTEGFSTCFLRHNGFWGLDCSQIAPNACVPPQDPNLITKPEVFYVAYNIYGTHKP